MHLPIQNCLPYIRKQKKGISDFVHRKVINTSSMKNLDLTDAFKKELTPTLNTVPPCNSSEEKWNMLHNTIFTKGLETLGSGKKPPGWFLANMDTTDTALDHKRSPDLHIWIMSVQMT